MELNLIKLGKDPLDIEATGAGYHRTLSEIWNETAFAGSELTMIYKTLGNRLEILKKLFL